MAARAGGTEDVAPFSFTLTVEEMGGAGGDTGGGEGIIRLSWAGEAAAPGEGGGMPSALRLLRVATRVSSGQPAGNAKISPSESLSGPPTCAVDGGGVVSPRGVRSGMMSILLSGDSTTWPRCLTARVGPWAWVARPMGRVGAPFRDSDALWLCRCWSSGRRWQAQLCLDAVLPRCVCRP